MAAAVPPSPLGSNNMGIRPQVSVAVFPATTDAVCIREVHSGHVTVFPPDVHGRRLAETFSADVVLDANAVDASHVIFSTIGKALSAGAVEGKNACLIAYGQTGTGKTSHMYCPRDGSDGVVARICLALTSALAAFPSYVETSITATQFEICNERVKDVLEGPSSMFIERRVRFHPEMGTYVEGLTRVAVTSADDVRSLVRSSSTIRRGDSGTVSHLVTQLQVRVKNLEQGVQRFASMSFVDLAGSEKGAIRQQGRNSHLSLHMLRRVVEIAAEVKREGTQKTLRLPVKESILTWLIGDVLNGNGLLSLLCTVSRDMKDAEETLRSLKFASQVSQMRLFPKVSEEKCNVVVRAIQQEMAAIQTKLIASTDSKSNEDINRLQKELSFRAQELIVQQNTKAKAREALHTQVEETSRELEALQRQLLTKQLVAAKAEKLKEELSRLELTRDIAKRRLAEEEALRKQTEHRIIEAKAAERMLESLHAERMQKEEAARQYQKAQSERVLRNVFVTATAMERDKQLRKDLETRRSRLLGIISDYQKRLGIVQRKISTITNGVSELAQQRDMLIQYINDMTASHEVYGKALRDAERETQLARDRLSEATVVEVDRMDSSQDCCRSSENNEPSEIHGIEENHHDEALDRCEHPVFEVLDPIHVKIASAEEELHEIEQALAELSIVLWRREEEQERSEGHYCTLLMRAQVSDEKILHAQTEIDELERELRTMEHVSSICNSRINDEQTSLAAARGEMMELDVVNGDSALLASQGRRQLLSKHDGEHHLSRSFQAQKEIMQTSSLTRRFTT